MPCGDRGAIADALGAAVIADISWIPAGNAALHEPQKASWREHASQIRMRGQSHRPEARLCKAIGHGPSERHGLSPLAEEQDIFLRKFLSTLDIAFGAYRIFCIE